MLKNNQKDKQKSPKDISGLSYGVASVGQIGFNIAIPILISVLAGRYLDARFFPNRNILTLILPLFGGFFGIWYVYKTAIIEIDKEVFKEEKDKKEEK